MLSSEALAVKRIGENVLVDNLKNIFNFYNEGESPYKK
jgi:hypothetical protein